LAQVQNFRYSKSKGVFVQLQIGTIGLNRVIPICNTTYMSNKVLQENLQNKRFFPLQF